MRRGIRARLRHGAGWACAGAFLLIAVAGCGGADEPEPDGGPAAEGIAVIVRATGGQLAPGIFDGTRDEAAARSDGSFAFDEGEPGVIVVPAGRWWSLADAEPEEAADGLAALVYADDESVAPGVLRGPDTLAAEIARQVAERFGIDRSAGPAVFDTHVAHSRAIRFEPGAAVRIVPPP